MPDPLDDEGKDSQQQELGLPPHIESKSGEYLPPVTPPRTSAPVHVNQQFNIQRIPPKAWDKLSPEQIVDLSKTLFSQFEKIDERHFELEMQRAKSASSTMQRLALIGGTVAIVGLCACVYLATHDSQVIAGVIATFLATIVAIVVGSRLTD